MNSSQRKFNPRASLALVFSLLCWSSMPLFLFALTDDIDGWVTNGTRYPFAALLWTFPLVHFCLKKEIPVYYFRLALVPSIISTVSQIFWSWTPYFLEPGKIMFMAQNSLIFSLLSSFLLFPEERVLMRSRLFWYGLFVCLTGFIGLNILRGNVPTHISWMGFAVILGHGMFSGFYAVSVRYFMRGIPARHSFPIICIYTAAVLLFIMLAKGDMAPLMNLSSTNWSLLGLSAIIGIALSHTTFYYAIEHLGVSICVSCSLVMPLLTTAGSYVIYGETFSSGQIISGIVLLSGAAMLIRAQLYLGESWKKSTAIEE